MKNWFNKHTKQSRFISSGPKAHGGSHSQDVQPSPTSKDGKYQLDASTGKHIAIMTTSGTGGSWLPSKEGVDLAKKGEGKLYGRLEQDILRSQEGYKGKDKVGFVYNGKALIGYKNPDGTYEPNVRGSKSKEREFMKRNQKTTQLYNRRNNFLKTTRDNTAGYEGTKFREKEEDS